MIFLASSFLPSHMSLLVKWARLKLWYLGSRGISFFSMFRLRRDILFFPFWFFAAVFGAASFAPFDPLPVEGAADDMVFDPWEVFDSASPYKDDTVFLQVVADAGDVGVDFKAV